MSARRSLFSLIASLGEQELQVLEVLAERLLAGQKVYGRLDLARDRRDWRRERSLEIQDLLLYSAFAELAATMTKAAPPAIEEGDTNAGDAVSVEVDRALG